MEYTEHKLQDMENEVDPENNFYNSSHNQCEYYTEEQFKTSVKMDGVISFISIVGVSMQTFQIYNIV